VTAELSSEQSVVVSNQVGFGGGGGMFLLGGLNTQQLFTHSPLVPAPYLRSFGWNGKIMQMTGGRLSGIRISEVLVWYSLLSEIFSSSAVQNALPSSLLAFSVDGMNQVGFSFGSGFWAEDEIANNRTRNIMRCDFFSWCFKVKWLPLLVRPYGMCLSLRCGCTLIGRFRSESQAIGWLANSNNKCFRWLNRNCKTFVIFCKDDIRRN